ncbi:NB-ARC [Dillenia turbinata]|uniref:NB-ARC n=1 Tax=Dillenia turbinata TaxID=194707 RepID=A0AAN8YV33_9MAGN
MAVVVDNLLRKLDERINYAYSPSVTSFLSEIKTQFQKIQPYLDEAEWMREMEGEGGIDVLENSQQYPSNSMVIKWLFKVGHLVHEVEDVIDTLYLQSFDVKVDAVSTRIQRFLSIGCYPKTQDLTTFGPQGQGFMHLINQGLGFIKFLVRYWVSSDLLKQFLEEVAMTAAALEEEAHEMHLRADSTRQIALNRVAHETSTERLLQSTKMVGRETELELLKHKLEDDGQSLAVVGVVGLTGIGKTTLATRAYETMKRNFDCCSFIFLPRIPIEDLPREVLKGILKSLCLMAPANLDGMDMLSVIEMIHHYLHGKKFLLVLDDVLTLDELNCITNALPHDCKVKLLFTSTGLDGKGLNNVIHLKPLAEEHAYKLLYNRAFLDDIYLPCMFRPLAREATKILEMCEGSPLAIATVGGALSSNPNEPPEWVRFHDRLKMAGHKYMLTCYASLPPVLKSCFLYAAFLPPHFEFQCKWLQRLWIAEGFVETLPNRTAEEVAESQMLELVQRNFLQVRQVGPDGEILSCWILQPLRKFAHRRAQQDHICTIFESGGNLFMDRLLLHNKKPSRRNSNKRSNIENVTSDARKGSTYDIVSDSEITLVSRDIDDIKITMTKPNFGEINLSRLYTFLVLGGVERWASANSSKLSAFKLLSVLEFHGLPIEDLVSTVGDLCLLRYLGLRGCKKLRTLPNTLIELQKLQTLDIRETSVTVLPFPLTSLRKLRHLFLASSFSDRAVDFPVQIEYLGDLQTLAGAKLTEDIARNLQYLSQLRKLSIGEVEPSHMEHLHVAFNEMNSLRSLTLKCKRRKQIDVKSLDPLLNLEKLRIGGQAHDLLHWVSLLSSLKYFYLWDCPLNQDPLQALHHLHSLTVLSLCNSYEGEQIYFPENSFRSLRKLSILHCRQLNGWSNVTSGTMAKLEIFTVASCSKLTMLPRGIENLASLQVLHVINMPETFVKEAREFHSKWPSKFSLHVQRRP